MSYCKGTMKKEIKKENRKETHDQKRHVSARKRTKHDGKNFEHEFKKSKEKERKLNKECKS